MKNIGRPKEINPEKLRIKLIGFHVSESEYKKLITLLPKEKSISEGLRIVLFSKNVTNHNAQFDLKNYIKEVNKIGSNLNQIARSLNTFNFISDSEKRQITENIALLNTNFEKVLKQIK